MVALMRCGDIEEYLSWREIHRGRRTYSEAWRRDSWIGSKPHLALLIDDDDQVRWLGRAQGGPGLTTVDRRVSVVEVMDVPAIRLDEIRQKLPNRHKAGLDRTGVLPPALGAAVSKAVRELLPEHSADIQRLERAVELKLPVGHRGDILNQERDALGLLFEICGIGRDHLRRWSLPPAEAPFLTGMTSGVAHEDSLISYDAGRFREWAEVPSAHVEWRVFAENNRRLFVMNANTKPVEHTLGVDLVYFNEARQSFVLVQYKKMRRDKDGERQLWYRPDRSLENELNRMRAVDDRFGSGDGEFRLCSQACWFKLCDPSPTVSDPARLVKGMYLARAHFEELLTTCHGPRGGVRLGYDNVVRHLDNTMFADLVEDGWIGTCGTGTRELGEVVRSVLETGNSVTVGVETADYAVR